MRGMVRAMALRLFFQSRTSGPAAAGDVRRGLIGYLLIV